MTYIDLIRQAATLVLLLFSAVVFTAIAYAYHWLRK